MTELDDLGVVAALFGEVLVDAVRDETAEAVRLAYAADVGAEFVPESVLAPRRSLAR